MLFVVFAFIFKTNDVYGTLPLIGKTIILDAGQQGVS